VMRLRKYRALSPAGRAIVLRSLLLLPAVAALLRLRGMERTRAWLARRGALAAGDASTLAPREIAALVGAASALLRARCLTRSLVLWHFLRNRASPVEIRLGVAKRADGSLSAHAWVEFGGAPLNEGADLFERYAALPAFAGQFTSKRPKSLSH
jgi:hypothetical protein